MYETGGRTVAVQPDTQIVLRMFDWVTAGLMAPGVSCLFGNPEASEYVAAPQAVSPRVAARMMLVATSTELFDVLRARVDSQRLL